MYDQNPWGVHLQGNDQSLITESRLALSYPCFLATDLDIRSFRDWTHYIKCAK
jgi:hypothetical protein